MSSARGRGPGDDRDPALQAPWVDAARRSLDASADALDAQTLSRLNRARQQALEHAHRGRARGWMVLLPLAAATLLAIAVQPWRAEMVPLPAPAPGMAEADWALLVADAQPGADALPDDAEFYEDLEFYAWLHAADAEG